MSDMPWGPGNPVWEDLAAENSVKTLVAYTPIMCNLCGHLWDEHSLFVTVIMCTACPGAECKDTVFREPYAT